jgi:hypothetical protein
MPVPESQIEVEAIRREKNNLSRLLKETLDSKRGTAVQDQGPRGADGPGQK